MTYVDPLGLMPYAAAQQNRPEPPQSPVWPGQQAVAEGYYPRYQGSGGKNSYQIYLDQLAERLRNGLQEELEKSLLALQSAAAGALSEGAGLLLSMGTDGALMFIAVVNQTNPASRIDIDYCRQRYSWEVETLRENAALLVMNGKEPDKEAFLSAKVMIDAAGMYQGASLSVHGASQSGSGALLLALTKKDPVKVVVVATGVGEMALGSLIAGTSSLRLVDNLQEMSSEAQGGSETHKNVNGYEAKVNKGQQNKHIPGTNEYKNSTANGNNRSTMNGNIDDIQNLLDEKAGTGAMIGNNKERVDFGQVIGQYVDPTTGQSIDTTVGIIHYGSKGAHIVPARPN